MTVVGKLLVFLNLVFSLVVGTFAVFDYSARTHWSEAYKKVEASNAVLQGTLASYKSEAEKLSKEKADLNNSFLAQAKELELKGDGAKVAQAAIVMLQDRKKSIDNLTGQLVALQAQLQEEKTKVGKSSTASTASLEDNKRKNLDVEKLRETLRAETERYSQVVKDMNVLRDKKTAAEIEAESLRDRNVSMLARLTDLERDNARLKANAISTGAGGGPGAIARKPTRTTMDASPPPDNVEGLVSRADGNLVKISVGSDSGVSKGNTLEVFRLGVTPKYLGRIRIVEVTPTEAVGQAMGRMSAPMQAGDRVANAILPR